jgi:hypothetical protein
MPSRRQVLLALPFVAFWIGGLALYFRFNWIFDYDTITREVEPLRPLAFGLPRLTAEVLVLYLILRPNSYRCSWGRVLLALAVFVPWFIYSIAFVMHAPGWVFAHAYWLLAVLASLVVLLLVSAVGAWRGSRRV